ncbi:hypothetical protein [Aliiroseovarius sp. 2305UL8-7]|uniref:hypothetical protein n=1 Tax=Aliiroseovarius conchicola TaxID=3121637 RepID=UPI0035276E81
MDEIEFSRMIDCGFPYDDRRAAIAIIDEASAISANAVFVVLDELCRPGVGSKVTEKTLSELIEIWDSRVEHPLSQYFAPAAHLLAQGSSLPFDSALELMDRVASFRGMYAALNIAYLSADDSDDVLGAREREIRADWDSTS